MDRASEISSAKSYHTGEATASTTHRGEQEAAPGAASVIPALGTEHRQAELCEFVASLVSIVSAMPAKTIQ